MDYKKAVERWHEKAKENESKDADYFLCFTCEYLAFIAYLRKVRYPYESIDRKTIEKLKSDETLKKLYLDKIVSKKILEEDWLKVIESSKEESFKNYSYNSEGQVFKQNWDGNDKGVIRNIEDWKNMIEFWNMIRNDMFHGAKDTEAERDSFVVEYGYRTLKELMEIIIERIIIRSGIYND